VSMADALAIAQYRVDIRGIEDIKPMNAASVVYDIEAGDKISVADALAINQYIVDIRDSSFELIP
jgi:hypothetical protein